MSMELQPMKNVAELMAAARERAGHPAVAEPVKVWEIWPHDGYWFARIHWSLIEAARRTAVPLNAAAAARADLDRQLAKLTVQMGGPERPRPLQFNGDPA